MARYALNTNASIGVYLTDPSTGSAKTGVSLGAVTATILKPGGTTTDVTLVSWTEVSSGAFTNNGFYRAVVPASALDSAGVNYLMVAVTGADPFPFELELTAYSVDDVYTGLASAGFTGTDRTNLGTILTAVGDIKGVGFSSGTESLHAIAGGVTSGGFSSTDRTTLGSAITHLTDIKGASWASGDNLHAIQPKTALLGTTSVATQADVTGARDSIKGSGTPDIAAVMSRLGTPAGASVSADIATNKTHLTDIKGASWSATTDTLHVLGANAGAFTSTDRANLDTVITMLTDIEGAGFTSAMDSLSAIASGSGGGGGGGFTDDDRTVLNSIPDLVVAMS